MDTPRAANPSTAFLVSAMSQRYRKTRPIVLLMAGWLLLGIILVANTLAHANADAGDRRAQECAASSGVPR
jgi:hypothetical protein